MPKKLLVSSLSTLLLSLASVYSQASPSINDCLINKIYSEPDQTSISELRAACDAEQNKPHLPERALVERATEQNAFVITPHRQNYVLPYTYNDRPNEEPFRIGETFPEEVDAVRSQEAKLQISFKIPLTSEDVFLDDDGLYFGFTLKSFWQVYNSDTSRPFRETNYRPEIYYQVPLPMKAWDGTFFTRFGFEHESNGRSQFLSRSWNRLYAGIGFARRKWVIYLQPWYRIPEDEKQDDGDPLTPPDSEGDDNPDIHRFLGHYELSAAWKHENLEITSLLRQNFNTGNGGIELGVSFPISGRLKGYVQYYNGYGESLIDYNHRVNRLGVGILLTDLL